MCSHFPNTFSRGTVQKFRGTLECRGTPFENPWLRGYHRANSGRYRLPVMQVHLHRVATCPAFLPLRCVL